MGRNYVSEYSIYLLCHSRPSGVKWYLIVDSHQTSESHSDWTTVGGTTIPEPITVVHSVLY